MCLFIRRWFDISRSASKDFIRITLVVVVETQKLFSVTVDLGVVIFVNAQNLIAYKDLPLAYLFKWLSQKSQLKPVTLE